MPYANPSAARARWARYYAANRERVLAQQKSLKHRNRCANGGGDTCAPGVTADEWEEILLTHGWTCHYCGAGNVKLTRDHVVPISRGGSDCIENVVPACMSCNASKGNKLVEEWRPA